MIPLINPDSSEVAVSYNLPRIIYIHIYIYISTPADGRGGAAPELQKVSSVVSI